MKDSTHNSIDRTCIDINGVFLAIGHRPAKKALTILKQRGFTHVVTILSRNEEAGPLIISVQKAGMISIHIPISSGAIPMSEENRRHLLFGINAVKSLIEDQSGTPAKCYIHCSAGIHRTGMMVFALLRKLGLTFSDSLEKLRELRPITGEQVGEERIQWIEENVVNSF